MSRRRSKQSNRGCCSLFLWLFIISIAVSFFAPSSKKDKKTEPSTHSTAVTWPIKETKKQSETPSKSETQKQTEKQAETRHITIKVEEASAFDLGSVPDYSGSPTTPINDNVPYFTSSDMTVQSFAHYGDLDSLGRCTAAIACIGTDIMPTASRGEVGSIKPTAWHLVKYDGIDGNYLYNRCHLIAYELAGENANEKNLITGTRYLNTEGMLPYENKVANYVQSTGNHVMYRVSPIFDGDNLLADGVLMEGKSVEDSGAGIQFCVFAYNLQPGITIDHANGDSIGKEYIGSDTAKYDGVDFSSPEVVKAVQTALNNAGYDCGKADGIAGNNTLAAVERYRLERGTSGSGIDAYLAIALGLRAYDLLKSQNQPVQKQQPQTIKETSTPQTSAPETSAPETSGPASSGTTYVVNTNTGKFHYPSCSSVSQMANHNRWDYTGSRDELIARGFEPCQRCNP